MADLPVLNALEELKESNKQAIQNLDKSFLDGVQKTTNSIRDMHGTLNAMFMLNKQMFDQSKIDAMKLLEQQREDSRNSDDSEKKVKEKEAKGPLSELLDFLRNGGLLAGGALLAGLAGAAVGLRGWEGKAISNLAKLSRIPKLITDGINGLRNSALRVFGLDPNGKPLRNAQGRFTGQRLSVPEQISAKMQGLKQSAYRLFGLGVDGKPVVKTPAWVKSGLKIGEAIKPVIDSIKNGFVKVISGIGKFFSASGPAGFIGRALGAIGRALRNVPIIGQIIGAVFAVFDGLFTAFETEGTFADKAQAFFAAAVSDFIGAPLDLLKDVFSWLASKFGFKGVKKFLDSFSVEDELEKVINGAIDMAGDVFAWIGTLFSDPTTALMQLWRTTTGGVLSMGVWIGDNLVTPAWNWFKGLFGFDEGENLIPEGFDPMGFLSEKVNKLLKFIYDPETGKIFGLDLSMESLLSSLPEFKLPTIDLPQIELPDFPNPFKDLQEKIKNFDYSMFDFGIVDFSDEIKSFMSGLFGEPTSVNAEGTTPTGAGAGAGAEVDVRSREVASAQSSPTVNVTAPQTNVQTDNSVSMNRVTMATASPRRGARSPQNRDVYSDPAVIF